ncbi:DUF932 domain-containing protein [Nonomuraea sp. NPDC050556]|uniref:DUF932 domain-containing protein n=1 Tax=Nonomuraea sp. NPDC050556 TaxID=3364369 RepID=UPI003794A1FA
MAHGITSTDSMFTVREPAWHGLAKVLDTAPGSWDEARREAGLDWDPIQQPVYAKRVQINADTNEPEEVFVPAAGWNEIVRSDNYDRLAISMDSLALITNTDMGVIADSILVDDKYTISTMGSLAGGQRVWALFELGDPIELKGDPSLTRRYMALMNSHDGHGSCRAIATNVRIVCQNTWHASEVRADADEAVYTFRHTKNWKSRVEQIAAEARQAIAGAQKQIELYRETAEHMILAKVTKAQEGKFLTDFIYPSANDHELSKIATTNVRVAREKLAEVYNSVTCEGIRGTAYGLMQAGGEYADHIRPFRNVDSYAGRSLEKTQELKKRAKNMAMAAAAKQL